MLVALESLTKRTPPISVTGSSACSSPVNAFDRVRHRGGLDAGERRHRRGRGDVRQQVAAEQLHRRQRHQHLIAAGRAPHDRVAGDEHAFRAAPARSRTAAAATARPAPAPATARRRHSAPPSRRPSGSRRSAPWPPRTPRCRRGDRGGRARSSAAPRSTDERSRSPSSWKLLASTTWIVSSVESSTCALSAWPMLPPTSTWWPPASSIRPVSVVVVDFPFVPVIATMRPRSQREASSSSPMTGTPAARALAMAGCVGGTPGLSTIRSAPSSVSGRCPPSSSSTPASRSCASSPDGVARVGQRHASRRAAPAAPRRRRRSARRRRRPPACPRRRMGCAVIAASRW